MSSTSKFVSINGFNIEYNQIRVLKVSYKGTPLFNLVKFPTCNLDIYSPINSVFTHDPTLIQLAGNIFETFHMLNVKGEHCVAAMFASYFYETLGQVDIQYKQQGRHILIIPFWLSVLELVKSWEQEHTGTHIHMGTPLYFLAEGYLLIQNNDLAFIYLIKSIEDDIELSEHCPEFQYPENEPAYLTACLIDNPNNHMYSFVVKPLRNFIDEAIVKYNTLFGNDSYLKLGMADFESKFLQRRNTSKLRIEPIKFLFVLELLQLHRLRNITYQSRIETSFSQMLRLNRLFSLTLVVDKLLHARYSPTSTKKGIDADMWTCIMGYAKKHGISQHYLNHLLTKKGLNFNARNPDTVLTILLKKKCQKRFRVLKREMYPILIAYKIRNTSAHKIHAISLLSSKFEEILQSLLEAVFTIAGQLPKLKR